MKDKLASVHPNARVHPSVEVSPFVFIDDNVEIGEGTWIGPNATIMSGARIGKHCKIFPGAVISAIPQDLKFAGEETTVEIGDNTTVREFATINRGTKDRNKTEVGSNCLIMAYVHIAHDCMVGNNCILANDVTLAGHIVIEDWAILEGLVAVQQFVKIGAHSFISGGSLVRKNVPPFVKAAREPLAYAGINSVGLKRRGFSDEVIAEIEAIYKSIYIQNKNISKGLEQLEENNGSDVLKQISAFIKSSEKGVIRSPIH